MKPNSRMADVIASPSNVVFLMLAFSMCIGFFMKLVSQENFIYLTGLVFAYYFGKAKSKEEIATALMTTPPAVPPVVNP